MLFRGCGGVVGLVMCLLVSYFSIREGRYETGDADDDRQRQQTKYDVVRLERKEQWLRWNSKAPTVENGV